MTDRIAEASPRLTARLAGLIALLTTTSAFSIFVRSRLVDLGDAAATVHNIRAHELLFRLGFVGDVISLLYIVYTLLLYKLFKPVSSNLSLLAAFFSLVGCAMSVVDCLLQVAPLVILRSTPSLSAFNVEQLQALALLFLKLHSQGYTLSMVLFGSYNIVIGYLIFKSTFIPRILGVFLAISGLCYLFDCFTIFLAPAFASHLVPYILIPGVAELLLAFWLLIFGVNVQRWNRQASATLRGMNQLNYPHT